MPEEEPVYNSFEEMPLDEAPPPESDGDDSKVKNPDPGEIPLIEKLRASRLPWPR